MLDNRQTNNRLDQEWYECDRCGFQYPREKMTNQNGLNLCVGPDTVGCTDKPGHSAAAMKLDIPYEERPETLPDSSEDL